MALPTYYAGYDEAADGNNSLSLICGATSLATSQYFAVSLGSAGLVVSTAGANCIGILQDNPIVGQAAQVVFNGVSKAAISASQTLSAGSLLEVDTGGTLKLHASGTIVGMALQPLTSIAAVTIQPVLLLKSNATF